MTTRQEQIGCNRTGRCDKCHKPLAYIGDVPMGGWKVGEEPYCTCGTKIYPECGQRTEGDNET